MEIIQISSKSKYELIDTTKQVKSLVTKSGVNSGLVTVFIPHTTAAIICNERERNLESDILKVLRSLDEHADFFGGFAHDSEEGNAHAHIATALNGSSRNFIIESGQLQLGTWQSILFLEMDGPREREVWVQIVSS